MSSEYQLGSLLIEGKTKQVYSIVNNPHEVLVKNKDRITAHNAATAHNLEGKALCSNFTNAAIFQYLNKAGLSTSFIKSLNDTEYLARRCTMVPIEWVSRRLATGSFLKRNPGVPEGFTFSPVKVETFYKDDALGDPEWSRAQVLCSKLDQLGGELVTEAQYEEMAATTRVVFEVLERAWKSLGCTLVDMKIEFGLDAETGKIILSDVIDNDSWRVWEGGLKENMKDKQVYRNLKDFSAEDMKKVKVNYDWVKEKVTELKEGPTTTVVILMGSPSDTGLTDSIKTHCEKLGLSVTRRVMSAHKVTEETLKTVSYYNGWQTPVIFIAVAGRSNGLGPVVSGNTTLPVINCPPPSEKDVWSSLSVPSGLGCATVVYPEAAALHAASIAALQDHRVWSRLRCLQLQRSLSLAHADEDLRAKDAS